MSNYSKFYKFCKLYKKELELENKLKPLGIYFDGEGEISQIFDELISMIPDLIFDEVGTNEFWENLCYSDEFSDEYIEELWEKLKDYQL